MRPEEDQSCIMPCYSDRHTQTKEEESGKIMHYFSIAVTVSLRSYFSNILGKQLYSGISRVYEWDCMMWLLTVPSKLKGPFWSHVSFAPKSVQHSHSPHSSPPSPPHDVWFL